MAELGQLLRQTRESKGLTLADVERVTRIRLSYLEALEAEDFDSLPGSVYVRGFLRNYANFLGLKAEEVLALYAKLQKVTASREPPESKLRLDVPIVVSAEPARRRLRAGWVFLAVLLGLALGAALWWAYMTYIASGYIQIPWPILLPALTQATLTPSPTFTPPPATPIPTGEIATTVLPVMPTTPAIPSTPSATSSATMTFTPVSTATPTYTPSPTATSTTTFTPTPKVYRGVELTVEITATTWLRVFVDGLQVYEGTLEPGEKRTWEGLERVGLRVGNAGGVILTVNGELIGPLGEMGQVIDMEWVRQEPIELSTPPSST